MKQITLLLTLLCVCGFAKHAQAQADTYTITEIGFFETSRVYSIVEKDGLFFLGTHNGLQVVDFSDVATPVVIGTLPALTPIMNMQLVGNLLIVPRNLDGVSIVDITDPTQPTIIGTHPVASAANDAFMGDSDVLYVAAGPPGVVNTNGELTLFDSGLGALRIVDATDPTALNEIGRYLEIPGFSLNVVAANDVVYVNNSGGSLFVIDVATPTNPQLITEITAVGNASEMTIVGNRLYVAEGAGMVSIYDISAPVPVLMQTINDPDGGNSGFAVAIQNGIAYVAAGWHGILLYDLSDASAPTYLGGYNPTFQPMCAVPVGDVVYLCDFNQDGVMIVQVESNNIPTNTTMRQIAISHTHTNGWLIACLSVLFVIVFFRVAKKLIR